MNYSLLMISHLDNCLGLPLPLEDCVPPACTSTAPSGRHILLNALAKILNINHARLSSLNIQLRHLSAIEYIPSDPGTLPGSDRGDYELISVRKKI